MSSGVFRGKESSNRIELSQLVQDLLNFGVLGSLHLWGGQVGGRCLGTSGGMGVSPHACMHMYRNCKWRHPCLSCLTCMCVHVCMHACMGHPHTPIATPPPSSHTLTNQDISILFEDLKSVETPPPMGGCMVWWVGGWVVWWVGSGQITKTLITVDPIKIIQFCLKIYDL